MSIALTGLMTGAALALASRVMSGEVELPDGAREKLSGARKRVELLGHLMGNFDATRPSTWSDFAARLLDASVDPNRRFANGDRARAWLDMESPVSLPELLTRRLMMLDGWARVYDGEQETVEVFMLTEDIVIAAQCAHQERGCPKLYTDKHGIANLSRLIARAADLFWEDRPAVRIEQSGDSLCERENPLDDFIYIGDNLALIEQWREFLAQGIRRTVLLQGEPGCGKTTMCHHAARELEAIARQTERYTEVFPPDLHTELSFHVSAIESVHLDPDGSLLFEDTAGNLAHYRYPSFDERQTLPFLEDLIEEGCKPRFMAGIFELHEEGLSVLPFSIVLEREDGSREMFIPSLPLERELD